MVGTNGAEACRWLDSIFKSSITSTRWFELRQPLALPTGEYSTHVVVTHSHFKPNGFKVGMLVRCIGLRFYQGAGGMNNCEYEMRAHFMGKQDVHIMEGRRQSEESEGEEYSHYTIDPLLTPEPEFAEASARLTRHLSAIIGLKGEKIPVTCAEYEDYQPGAGQGKDLGGGSFSRN